jgi:leucine dehydrogenase
MYPVELMPHPDFDQHESVVFSPGESPKAIIAIPSSKLGSAVGGCRIYPYVCHEETLAVVLRPARGMIYKSALAVIPFGGG